MLEVLCVLSDIVVLSFVTIRVYAENDLSTSEEWSGMERVKMTALDSSGHLSVLFFQYPIVVGGDTMGTSSM